jgi:hypothetical protein
MIVADGLGESGAGSLASRVALSTIAYLTLHYGKWNLRIDPRVLVFATALCGITGMLSGVVPAIAARRVSAASALRATRTLGLGRLTGPSSALLISQVAVTLVLLAR